MISAIRQYESAMGIHVSPVSCEFPSHLPPHPVPPGCHRALALGALHHAPNSQWLSVLHMVIYMSQYTLKVEIFLKEQSSAVKTSVDFSVHFLL